MCVLVGKNEIIQAAGSATIVATLPDVAGGILANDVIIVAVQNGTAASNITENTTTEYTEFGTQVTNDTQRVALFRKIASGSDVSRTFNLPATGGGSDSICIVTVWRYVDVTGDPIRAIQRTDYAAGSYAWENNTGTISANDGDLLVFLNVQDGNSYQRYNHNRVMFVARTRVAANNGSMVMGMRQLTATGTTTAEKIYCDINEGGTGYVFALKNASGGAYQPMAEPDATVLNYFGNFADFSTTSQQKWSTTAANTYAANDISASNIAGIAVAATTATVTPGAGTGIAQSTLGIGTQVSPTDSSTGIWGGATRRLPAAVDATGKIYRVHFRCDYSLSRVGAQGMCVRFGDSGGKWVAYTLATGAALLSNNERTAEIALGNATLLDSSETPSTFDWANLTKISYLEHRVGLSASANPMYFKDELLLGTCVVTGGGAEWQANWSRIAQLMTGWEFYKLADLQGGVQAVFKHSIQICDNSRPTYWDSTGGAFAFPTSYNKTTGYTQQEWNVNAGVVGVVANPSATDTVSISSGSAYTETQQALTMTGSASANTSLAQSFVGFAPTLLSGETYSGATFSGCDTVLATGATLTGCTIRAPNANVGASDAAVSWTANSTTQANNTIDITGSSAGYFAAFGASITAIEWNNNTLTGTPASGFKFYSALTSGELVITTDGTGTAIDPGDVEFAAGTAFATVVAPTVTADISITGMSNTVGANTRLQIINQAAAAAASRANSTAYSAGDVRLRQTGAGSENTAGLYLRCTTSGISDASPPTWNTTVGGTTTDGTVVWTTYAILYYDADPAATSLADTYIDGEEFKAGETVEIRFAEEDPAVSFKTYNTSVIAATTGFSALANSTADSVYATYALSGAAYDTTYSPNYVASYLVLDTNTNFTGASSFAYYCYLLTTSEGMYRFWGGLTALDAGNVRNNVDVLDLFFDETAGFVRQTDDVRIFKSDGTRPALDPTTGGAGIEINWKVPVNVVTTGGSAVLPQDVLDIADAVWAKTLP